jgi:hypothetical protein
MAPLHGYGASRPVSTHRVVILGTILLALAAVPVQSAGARTYIVDGGWQRLAYKPTSWAAGGVGASARMDRIRWTHWGSTRAVARGTTVNNACDPSCAEGTTYRYPGTMTWTKPRYCHSGTRRLRYFTNVRYTIELPPANGFGLPAGKHPTTFTWPARYSSSICHR